MIGIWPLEASDWPRVREIYLEGIATGNATFETVAPDWEVWDAKHLAACRLVVRTEAAVVGWAALSPVSSRCVYAGVAEISLYVAGQAQRQGIGKLLLRALIEQSEHAGIWTLQAGIFPENVASIHLHERAGFRLVGVREKLGSLKGVWRDVAVYERRSAIAGR